MGKSKFKERAYKILYQEYKNLFERIRQEAMNKSEYGKDEDKIKLLSSIADHEQYSYNGFIGKEDIKVIKTLEKCLGEHELVAK